MTLGGEDLRDARILAGYPDRAEFAALVGVSPRTVEGWEARKGRVPANKEALVRKVLADRAGPPLLDQVSNMDLVSALAERLAYYERVIAELEARTASQSAEPTSAETGVGDSPTAVSGVRRNPVQGVAGPSLQRRRRNDAHTEDR